MDPSHALFSILSLQVSFVVLINNIEAWCCVSDAHGDTGPDPATLLMVSQIDRSLFDPGAQTLRSLVTGFWLFPV